MSRTPLSLYSSYYIDTKVDPAAVTNYGGIFPYLDLMLLTDLPKLTSEYLPEKSMVGWQHAEHVAALLALNLTGGDCVDDMRILEKDGGFCRVLGRVETRGLSRKRRRARERRWRKEQHRSIPSPSAVFRYLEAFHDPEEEKKREKGKAFIPAANEHLQGLMKVHRDFVASVQTHRPKAEATLDADATLVHTQKEDALFSYKGYQAYQPHNVWWAEQELMLHTEFRDGNVPAGYEQLRVFKEALDMLPEGVTKVYLRSDTAGYQHDLLRYCEKGENTRFGRIEFAIGADVTKEFKKAVAEMEESEWKPVMKTVKGRMRKTKKEWAEVCFVPNEIAFAKNAPVYRYVATRELLEQPELPGMEGQLPFPTLTIEKKRYKIFGIVTNRDLEGSALVNWLHTRCGKSEETHSTMKEDLAGGKLPSSDFGENAAWWWIAVLAFNLNSAMKQLVLKESWTAKRMKAIRFSLISLPGRVMEGAHEMMIRIAKGHPSFSVLLSARRRIMELAYAPSG